MVVLPKCKIDMAFCHGFGNKNWVRHLKIIECTNFKVKCFCIKLYEKSFEDNSCGMMTKSDETCHKVHTIVVRYDVLYNNAILYNNAVC